MSVVCCEVNLPDTSILYDPETTPERQDGVVTPACILAATYCIEGNMYPEVKKKISKMADLLF